MESVWDLCKKYKIIHTKNCDTTETTTKKTPSFTQIRHIMTNTSQLSFTDEKLIQLCQTKRNLNINCRNIFEGNLDEIIKAKKTIGNYSKSSVACSLDNLLKNCEVFIRAHGYITEMSDLSPEELSFPLAFSIKMHKSSEQAEQLLRNIYRPHNMYCIYIDEKADNRIHDKMKRISECLPNISVIEKRINIVYASFAHIIAELQCMTTLVMGKAQWKYYINLTGQEFPLRTNREIVKILKSMNGSNDVESYPMPKHLKEVRLGIKYFIKKDRLKHHNETKPPFKYHIEPRKGSAYGAFRRNFVEFIITDKLARDFIAWLGDTLSPEETVWSTLNALPWAPGGFDVETKHSSGTFLSRAMKWAWDKVKCEGKLLRGVCVLGVGDLPWLRSKPQLFANKFDRKFDPFAIDCMEEIIRNRTFSPCESCYELDWYYYKNLPQSRYNNELPKWTSL